MLKVVLQVFSAIVLMAAGYWFVSDELRSELIGMSIGIGLAVFVQLIAFLYEERNLLGVYLNSLVFRRNKSLRLTLAYIFRIEAQGKYLLVKNSRFSSATYQPVGGVYKYFSPEATKHLHSLTIVTDNSIDNDERSDCDLRVKIMKRKHLRRFLHWFFGQSDREIDPWREFYEELVKTNVLSRESFPFIFYDLLGQHIEPIHFDTHFKIDTLKYVDIFALRPVNHNQKYQIEKLISYECEEYIWVTEEEIRNGISKCGKRIAPHTNKIFQTQKLT